MKREDRETWEDLDDDERLEAYADLIEERDRNLRPLKEAYYRFVHLDKILECVGDSDGTENTDPFHPAARDLWRAVKVSLGIPSNDKLTGQQKPEKGMAS